MKSCVGEGEKTEIPGKQELIEAQRAEKGGDAQWGTEGEAENVRQKKGEGE